MASNNLPDPGEFTKLWKRSHLGTHDKPDPEKAPDEVTALHPTEATTEQPVPPSAVLRPTPAPAPEAPPAEPKPFNSSEGGEFTQYFRGGLPSVKPSAGNSQAPRPVQRPSTAVPPPRNLVSDNSGTFTEKFTPRGEPLPVRRSRDFGAPNPPDLGRKPFGDYTNPYDVKPPVEPAPEKKPVDEYEALFGRGNQPPPSRPSAMGVGPVAPLMNDSPNAQQGNAMAERTMRDMPVPVPSAKGPSEFTVIQKGRLPEPGDPAAAASPEAPAAAPAGGGAGAPKMTLPVNVNINPVNPLSALPHLGGGGGAGMHMPGMSANASLNSANVNTPLGSASAHGPQIPRVPQVPPLKLDAAAAAGSSKLSDQTKMILFFGILAILAVALVVILVAKQKT